MSRIVVLRRGHPAGSGVELIGSYVPELVEALKRSIPYRARRWNPDAKCWCVDESWASVAWGLAQDYADEVIEAWDTAAVERRPRATPVVDADAATLHVAADAPIEVVQAAYRALSRLHHPDVAGAGSTARMQAINAAHERLTRRREVPW